MERKSKRSHKKGSKNTEANKHNHNKNKEQKRSKPIIKNKEKYSGKVDLL